MGDARHSAASAPCLKLRTMLAKCANPECSRPFHYLRDGSLIVVRRHDWPHDHGHPAEYFWLCAQCAPHYEVVHAEMGKLSIRKAAHPERASLAG